MCFSPLFKGLGGTEVVKPRCTPGVCFREDMCIETADGVECGPCPDGYTGDGFNCDDVDEVRLSLCVCVCLYFSTSVPTLRLKLGCMFKIIV